MEVFTHHVHFHTSQVMYTVAQEKQHLYNVSHYVNSHSSEDGWCL